MGFTEVASLDADVTVALGKVDKKTGKPYPKQAEGYFLGTRTVENKRGESKLHFLQTAKGNLGVWGTTDLNRKLGQVKPGTMIRITSTGTKSTPNGDMYTYKVEQDQTNSIEVAADETVYAGGMDEATDYVDSDDQDNYESNDDTDNYLAGTNAALSASRKAEVEGHLKSRSKKN